MRNVPYAIVYACVECDYGTLDAEIFMKHMKAVHYHHRRDFIRRREHSVLSFLVWSDFRVLSSSSILTRLSHLLIWSANWMDLLI